MLGRDYISYGSYNLCDYTLLYTSTRDIPGTSITYITKKNKTTQLLELCGFICTRFYLPFFLPPLLDSSILAGSLATSSEAFP